MLPYEAGSGCSEYAFLFQPAYPPAHFSFTAPPTWIDTYAQLESNAYRI